MTPLLFRYCISGIFMLFFVWIALANMRIAVLFITRGKRGSTIPFVGGLAGAVSLWICPYIPLSRRFWLPALLDIGCLPLLVAVMIFWTRRLMVRVKKRDAD